MAQVRLIPGHHYNNVRVCMIPQLTKPPLHIVESLPLGYVVDKKRPNCSPIISTSNSSIPLLTSSIPYLRLDFLVANSTPIVDLDSKQNSFLVYLERMLDLPTPESPINTILNR
ncbi:hypothetical protein CRG98_013154 [Punica granatum]|uniref:Uncharacterized protein n=1 Tax=Punica granatum TaxID=22663 RepID=A0A2I0KDA3_PUNGR|nr:hypothetical protein CRG98_013154 [Punica granatum]